jgi:capsular polysaccharide biosynthesis protein
MNKYREAILFMQNGNHLPERLWAADDYPEIDDRPADSSTGLASLGFIRAALRRSAWLWCTMAIAGMAIGFGLSVKLHPVYQASTTLLLTPMTTSNEDVATPITNEEAVAHSRPVAQLVMGELGLQESVSRFLSSYTVTGVTDRILNITVSSPSSNDAVNQANAIAAGFLRYRAELVDAQQKLLFSSFDQEITTEKQYVASITTQIDQVSAKPSSPTQQSELANLQKQSGQATNALATLEQSIADQEASAEISTDTVVRDSQQLGPASPVPPHSKLKRSIEYTALGLLGGLALGLGIVVIRALVSNRLRRRDDVAHALGAPVKLSVGPVRLARRRGLAAARSANVRRVAGYLNSAVLPRHHGPASLAVVPVDDVRVPALCLVSLALSRAQQDVKVVVADLCDGSPAARLLHVTAPGVQTVSVQGAQLVVMVPGRDEIAPAGPLPGKQGQAPAAEPLAEACASADLLLTLAALDPSLGWEHLSGWARGAVAMVTAGQSSAARIRAVGEMIRLAGTRLISGVLIGVDKTDESLGVPLMPEIDDAAVAAKSVPSDSEGFFLAVDDIPGGRT